MSPYIETQLKQMISNFASGTYDLEASREVNYGLRTLTTLLTIQAKEHSAKAIHGARLTMVPGLNAPAIELVDQMAPAPSKTPKLAQAK